MATAQDGLIGSLVVTGSSVAYMLPHIDTTVSRDLLATLPRYGESLWTAHDCHVINAGQLQIA